MNAYLNEDTIALLLPEILLVALATWTFVGGAFSNWRSGFHLVAVAGMGVVALALLPQDMQLAEDGRLALGAEGTSGPLIIDFFGHAARWVALIAGLFFVLTASRAAEDQNSSDYLGSLLLVIAGWMLTCQAGDLALLFLALELISIPTYVLLYLGRRDRASQEATSKYFYLSIFSSAILLYGFSFLYGACGSISLADLGRGFSGAGSPGGAEGTYSGTGMFVPLGLLLVLGGVAFKMAVVPMHFYAADVYQGTTNGNAGLLAVVPKAAGLILLIRVLAPLASHVAADAWQVAVALAIVTMTLGNVMALWQRNIRRLLAYSSIAHAGYMLIGVSVALYAASQDGGKVAGETLGSFEGIGAALFYLLVYVLATLGAFAALVYLSGKRREINRIEDLAGLARTYPLVTVAMAVFLFSLTGLPPLAGFWGKWTLFLGAVSVAMSDLGSAASVWFAILAAVTAVNAAISAGYYLRVIGAMCFRAPQPGAEGAVIQAQGGQGSRLVAVAAAVLVVAVSVWVDPLIGGANRASRSAMTQSVRRDGTKTQTAEGKQPIETAVASHGANIPGAGARADDQ